MKNVNVYGPGCKNCTETARRITAAAEAMGVAVQVQKVSDLEAIMNAGVVSTPGVSIDGVLVHSGSVPTEEKVKEMLSK